MKKQNNLHLVIVIFLGVLFFNILTSCSSGDSSKSENSYFTNNVAKDSTMHVNGIVNKNGVKLYYEVVGSGKDTLVFLHGTPSTMYAFVKDLESFSNYFTMIFYDQRGGGRSSLILNPDSLTWQENVKDLEAIRAYFNINKLNILGISWGSALAALYADTFPDNIKSLILFPMRARKNPGVPKNAKPRQPLLDSLSNKRMNELLEQWESADDPIAICEEYWSIISEHLENRAHKSRT